MRLNVKLYFSQSRLRVYHQAIRCPWFSWRAVARSFMSLLSLRMLAARFRFSQSTAARNLDTNAALLSVGVVCVVYMYVWMYGCMDV